MSWRIRPVILLAMGVSLGACVDGDDKDVVDTEIAEPTVIPPATPVLTLDGTPTTMDDLVAEATGLDADATYTWTWTRDGDVEAYTDGTVPASATSKGEVWTVSLAGERDGVAGAAATASTTVINTPPEITALELGPEAPLTVDALVASASATDADGDEIVWNWVWTVDNHNTLFDDDTIPPSATTREQTWRVVAAPFDGEHSGGELDASVTVLNSAPVVTTATVAPDPAFEDSVLEISLAGVDDDPDDEVVYSWEWFVDGVSAGSQETLNGAEFSKGHEVHAEVTGSDGLLSSEVFTSDALVILNSPPELIGGEVSPGEADESTTLTCTADGTFDADGDDVAVSVNWFNGGALAVVGTVIDGASFDKHDELHCTIETNDGEADGGSFTSDVIVVANTPPVVGGASLNNLAPTEFDTLGVDFSGVGDIDGDAITMSYAWFVNDVQLSTDDTLPPDAYGAGDRVYCEVTPFDGEVHGLVVRTGTAMVGNSSPSIQSVSITPDNPGTADDLVASVEGTDPDGDTLTYAYLWTVDGVAVQGGASDTLASDNTSRGQEVALVVIPNDGSVDGGAAFSDPVTVVNTLPAVDGVELLPDPLFTADDAFCQPGPWSDPDGDAESYLFRWWVNGAIVPTLIQVLNSDQFAKGDVVGCAVTPQDVFGTGQVAQSLTLNVFNTPPVLFSAELDLFDPVEGDELGVVPGVFGDADGDSVLFHVRWFIDGELITLRDSLGPTDYAKGDVIHAEVYPFDGEQEGDPVLTSSTTVLNTPPESLSVSIAPLSPSTVDDIVASVDAADNDGDALTWTYVWSIDGVPMEPTADPVLSADLTARDALITVDAYPSDDESDGAQLTSNEALVVNTAPSILSATIVPDVVFEDSELTCVPAGWVDPDGDPASYSFTWYVAGLPYDVGDTIDGEHFSSGDDIRCSVTPFDPVVAGPEVFSSAVDVLNTPPEIGAVTIPNTSPEEGDTLSVLVGFQQDIDGGEITLEYAWFVDGTQESTAATLPSTFWVKGQDIWVVVTPSDLQSVGTSVQSNVVEAVNAAPEIASVTISPDSVTTDQFLEAFVETTDADGDEVTHTKQWLRNGVPIAGQTGSILASVFFTKNQTITVEATPYDGTELGAAVVSAGVTVSNSPPSYLSASVFPVPLYESSTATCTPTLALDVDSDGVTPRFEWWVNGTSVAFTQSVDGSVFSKGQAVFCRAYPDDGQDEGEPVDTATLVAQNTAPTIGSVSLSTASPTAEQFLSATISGASDLDGDSLTFTYAWFVNGVQTGTGQVLNLRLYAENGDTVFVKVTPHDDETAGAEVTSNFGTVQNSLPVVDSITLRPDPPRAGLWAYAEVEASDTDGDEVSLGYEWWVDGSPVWSSTTSGLPDHLFVPGASVMVRVTPSDGIGAGSPSDSASAVATSDDVTCPDDLGLGPTCPALSCGALDVGGAAYGDGPYFVGHGIEVQCVFSEGEPYTTFEDNDFSEDAGGWSFTTITTCNGNPILGGYGALAAGTISQSFDLTGVLHDTVTVSGDAWFIDSWDGESAWLDVDGTQEWTHVGVFTDGTAVCGSLASPEWLDSVVPVSVSVPHTASSVLVEWGNNLDQAATDESFAVDNVRVTTSGVPAIPGLSADDPGASCNAIAAVSADLPDGLYWIDPLFTGAFMAYCEMNGDGTAWTLLSHGGVCGGMAEATSVTGGNACTYLSNAVVMALAERSSQVKLTVNTTDGRFGSWDETANPTSTSVLAALAAGEGWHELPECTGDPLTAGECNGAWDAWAWDWTCDTQQVGGPAAGWPDMYWSCGLGSNVHWMSGNGQAHVGGTTPASATWVGGPPLP